ncbi:NAD-dependent epimerase/dehydratase family protein, partial [Mycolicibacterium insubricum]|uniref:NAD-dependent epimerase/dehydratase family protein n=1 Tax=Mycolicibacterium insubricum TaxID=444597 RepID=UPI002AE6ABAB|nr:NAD(P)-dependent oxidoreductase [Mycolicibacterium insubricum]
PGDLYGSQKLAAEELVRSSDLDWSVLRLGGVISVGISLKQPEEMLYFESLLPTDGRLQTVDVRDVASAFSAATVRDGAIGKILLIGGDNTTHRKLQGTVAEEVAEAMGMTGGLSPGRPGNPDSDVDWFATDWMDTAEAQEILGFQNHGWPQMLAEVRALTGAKRPLFKLAGPVARGLPHPALRLLPLAGQIRRPVDGDPGATGRPGSGLTRAHPHPALGSEYVR